MVSPFPTFFNSFLEGCIVVSHSTIGVGYRRHVVLDSNILTFVIIAQAVLRVTCVFCNVFGNYRVLTALLRQRDRIFLTKCCWNRL